MTHNPKVWTDHLGVWRASVPLSGNRNRDAHAARHLIRTARQEAGLSHPRPITVVRERVTNHGTATYREV